MRKTGAQLALLVALSAAPARPQGSEQPLHERIDLPSLAACGGCHQDVYRAWSASLHARAWTNANARQATDDFERATCRPCHSPLPVLGTGLDRRPEHRDFNQPDGVHCLACHGRADGVAAARTIPDAPCRPRFDPRLTRADLCYPCHEPTHGAFAEYAGSAARARGTRCQDCHMPVRAGGGHDHGPRGGLDPAFVRRALTWSAAIEEDALVVRVRNRTGHRFPGEIPSRALLVQARFDTSPQPETALLRKPQRGEERVDDRLGPDEERALRFPFPAGARTVELALLFRPYPWLPPEACHRLGEWSGERP